MIKAKKFLKTAGAPLFLAAALGAAPAQAVIVIDDWQIDLSAVVGQNLGGVIGPIDEIGFTGLFHSVTDTTVAGNPALPDTGDTGSVVFSNRATAISGNGAPQNSASGTGCVGGTAACILGTHFEITTQGRTDFKINGPGTFVPNITGNGFLDIYIHDVLDSSTNTDGTGGDGFGPNGTLVASFAEIKTSTDGGIFNPTTFDGSTDNSFVLVSAMAGVFLDQFGNPLAIGATLGVTDANTDAAPGGIAAGQMTVSNTAFIGAGGALGACGQQLGVNFCGTEDGSLILAELPEPTSLALIGIGLLALGARRRRQLA